MLSPEMIKKIKKIHIKSSRKVNTLMAGQYRSVFRGSGIEFEEVREYSPGDDVKSIDWKSVRSPGAAPTSSATARSGSWWSTCWWT